MAELSAPLILASGSPRRLEILQRLGIACRVRPSDVPEIPRRGEDPGAFAARAATDKVAHALVTLASEGSAPSFVLGADTVVAVDNAILGKPTGDADAAAMLRALSGRWHQVVTGVALGRMGKGMLETSTVVTLVAFRRLSDETVQRYVATGEGRDKAGAYAVQGVGSGLVREVRGSYDNVVGLPAVETLDLLQRHGALRGWP